MAELKKTPFSSVKEQVVSMEFEGNPNIPTANYSAETANRIQEAIKKKMRAEKLKKMIETELKNEKKKDDNDMAFSFSFKGM